MAGAPVLPSSIGAPAEGRLKLLCSNRRDLPASTSSSLPFRLHLRSPPLPRSSFFSWDARSHIGSRIKTFLLSRDWKNFSKTRARGVVHASLLGVGAPEALVIAVVALLVFGPKGLAEVARTLGKSLRAFQPTIRELQQISRDFKDTLEQEIGLDELRTSEIQRSSGITSEKQPQSPSYQNGPVEQKPYSAEDYVRVTEEQVKALVPEEQRRAAEDAAWGGSPPKVNKTIAEEQMRDPEETTDKHVPLQ